MEGVRITPQRKLLIQTLREFGPIEDEHGKATAMLQRLMEVDGYPQGVSQAGFSNLLYKAEQDGLIVRDRGPNQAKLTYSISLATEDLPRWCIHCGAEILGHPHARYCDEHRSPKARGEVRKKAQKTGEVRKKAVFVGTITKRAAQQEESWGTGKVYAGPPPPWQDQQLPGMPEPEISVTDADMEEARAEVEAEEAAKYFNYDELARRVLAEATRAIARAEQHGGMLSKQAGLEQQVKELEEKLIRANTAIAAAEFERDTARQNIDQMKAEHDAALKLAEEEEQAVTVFKKRCEEMQQQLADQNEEIARLKGVVKRYREQERAKGNGRGSYKLPELAGPEGMEALARIMSETPEHA